MNTGHVVIVEDDNDIAFLLMNMLEKEDWLDAIHIPSSLNAKDEEIWRVTNVIGIFDLYLPELNGVELAEWVKTEISTDIPLLAITASSPHSDLFKEAQESGYFIDVMEKPLSSTVLMDKLRRAINE